MLIVHIGFVFCEMLLFLPVLICLGCYNRYHGLEWLINTKFISHSYGLKFKIKVLANLVCGQSPLYIHANHLLAVSSHGSPLEYLLQGTDHPHDLITSQKLRLPIPSHWGLLFQHIDLRDTNIQSIKWCPFFCLVACASLFTCWSSLYI